MDTKVKKSKNNYSAYYDEKAIILIRKKLTGIMFDRHEKGLSHNTLQWEENAFEAVKSGKEAIQFFLAQDADGVMGILSDDSLRDLKNNCICTVCVLTRQIVHEHLLDLEHAFSMSDACIQCIEACTSETECIRMTIACMVEFSSMIELKPKSGYHPLVRQTREYVFKHLHEKIDVRDVARRFKTHPDYQGFSANMKRSHYIATS